MVWQPRIGAAADSRPKYQNFDIERDGNLSEAHANSRGSSRTYEDPAGFDAFWLDAALYVWGEASNPTFAELQQNASIAVVKLPPEIEGQGTQLLYLVEGQWPDEGTYPALLGLFIYSRPAGSTSWRVAIDYRPFTPEIEATKGTLDYRFGLATVPADEYQLRTRWAWQAPGEEISSDVLAGADVPGVLYLLVAEMCTAPASHTSSRVKPEEPFSFFIQNRYYSLEQRFAVSAEGISQNFDDDQFYALRADTFEPLPPSEASLGSSQSFSIYRDQSFVLFIG